MTGVEPVLAMRLRSLFLVLAMAAWAPLPGATKYKVMIVDGQNNHAWRETTPLIRRALASCGRFTVDVATSPEKGADLSGFLPKFSDYDVVVSNYNGESWGAAAKAAFEEYVSEGGGFVSVHAADNAFPKWDAYNRMIGIGGWGSRDARWGPKVRFRGGRIVWDASPGRAGHHGQKHAFQVIVREPAHPITAGLPEKWMHAEDELYDSLRGPVENLTVLATAYSDPATGGSGEHEPVLMTIEYGNGRVFHTTLGHDEIAMGCAGFLTTLQRGTEWAASGKVTQGVPSDFPTEDQVRVR